MKVLIFLALLVLIASLSIGVLFHEATHLALATKPTGICFGVCGYYNPITKDTSYAPASAWGEWKPENTSEFYPTIVQNIVTGIIAFFGIGFLCRMHLKTKKTI